MAIVDVTITSAFKDKNYFDNLNRGTMYVYAGGGAKPFAPVHNQLQSLQGGTTNEYYHLTSAQHTAIVLNNQVNTYGDFAQTFKDNIIRINNPADTFYYTITAGAIAANRILNLPIITSTDTLAVLGLAQTLTNKTIALGSNTVSGTIAQFQTAVTDATLVTAGAHANTYVAYWNATTNQIEGSANLVFTATGFGIGTVSPTSKLDIIGTQITGEDDFTPASVLRLARDVAWVGGRYPKDSVIDFMVSRYEDPSNAAKTQLDFRLGHNDDDVSEVNVMTLLSSGNVGIGKVNPSYKLDVDGTGGYSGLIENPSFTSGFQGTNWQITEAGDAEFRNVLISGGLQVYELILNRLHYQCGGLIIGAGGGKVRSVDDATAGAETLTFEDPEGNANIPFTVGMIVLVQDFDLDRTTIVKKIVREVDAINSDGSIDFTTTDGWLVGNDTGVFVAGDEVVAIGDTSSDGYDANIYMSAVDSNNPFLRVFDGVDSYSKWSLGDKTAIKLQLGNLESLAGYDIVPASPGYGLYSSNVYLIGKIVATSGTIGGWTIDSVKLVKDTGAAATSSGLAPADYPMYAGATYANRATAPFRVTPAGVVTATSGLIGGWTIAADAIYTGTKKVTDGYSVTGITLDANGAIHSPNFYIDSDGDVGFRAKEIIYSYKGVSDDIILSHDAEANSDIATYTIVKTITFKEYIQGSKTLRIKFEMKTSNELKLAYARIYNGDVAVGDEHNTPSEIYVGVSQDIAGWEANDVLTLRIKIADAEIATVRNLRVCGIIATQHNEIEGDNS